MTDKQLKNKLLTELVSKKENLFKRYWFIPLILSVPIILNWSLQLQAPINIIGDSESWLNFFGMYSGSIVTLYVLYKTVKHNQKNNQETQNQQIAIMQNGIRERWLNDLVNTLKKNLSYVNLQKITYHTYNCHLNLQDSCNFFLAEVSKGCNTDIETTLDFLFIEEEEKDTVKAKYIDVFREISNKQGEYLNIAYKILSFVGKSNLTERIELLHKKYEADKKSKVGLNGFTETEYLQLKSSTNNADFNQELATLLNKRFNTFIDEYQLLKPKLDIVTQKLVEHEKDKVFNMKNLSC
jgi:hypothetical protein